MADLFMGRILGVGVVGLAGERAPVDCMPRVVSDPGVPGTAGASGAPGAIATLLRFSFLITGLALVLEGGDVGGERSTGLVFAGMLVGGLIISRDGIISACVLGRGRDIVSWCPAAIIRTRNRCMLPQAAWQAVVRALRAVFVSAKAAVRSAGVEF